MGFRLNKFKECLVFLLICQLYPAGAQPSIWKEMKKIYPDESAIYLNRNKIITLDTEGELVTATATVEEKILFLKDRPDNTTDMVVYGSHFQEIENLKAFTSVWDKTKYREIPLSGLTRQQESNSSIFFDDSYFYRLSFPLDMKVIRHRGVIVKFIVMHDF